MQQSARSRLAGAIALGASVSLWVACAGDGETAPTVTVGAVEVTTATTGEEIDADGYTLSLDGGAGLAIDANGAVMFSGLDAGDHELELTRMAANCTVEGSNPRTLTLAAGETAQTTFQVSCAVGQAALRDQIVFAADSMADWENGIYDNEIYVMNVDGSGLMNLTNDPANDFSPAVSPDGTRILFVTDRYDRYDIYVMNADGSGTVNLTHNPARDTHPVWSPDGTKIAFTSFRDDTGKNACYFWSGPSPCADIFVMNADGSNPVNLTNNASAIDWEPAWSPDGTKIVFASDRDAGGTPDCPDCWEIFVMDADGSNVVKLTEIASFNAYKPAWSPDGDKIAFTNGAADIWVINADGSNPVNLTGGTLSGYPAMWPSWSPDGSRIAFTVSHDCGFNIICEDVFIMNADGSNPVNLSNRPAFDDFVGTPQAWSPQ